jgi:hypothetical protein
MNTPKCEHKTPTCSCDEYRHIRCGECGKTVCAGCGSFNPAQTSLPLKDEHETCPTCNGKGYVTKGASDDQDKDKAA